MIRVGVIGAAGRMGSETCRAVDGASDLELAARIARGDALEDLVTAKVDVAVEFSTPDTVAGNARFCLSNGIHSVVGATGLSDDDLAELGAIASERGVGLFVAPNFAIGAVLMMRFAAQAAAFFERAEIVERHHERKLDAPSGTALKTAAGMSAARREPWQPGTDERETLEGARGGDREGVRIHSLRLPGSVAHQEVLLGGHGETLTIRHDSLERSSFMPGVLLAIRRVASLSEPTVGLEHLLDL